MGLFANRKARNRRRSEKASWEMPEIDWRRLTYGMSGFAAVAAFLWLIVSALDQPIDRVVVEGRFQRVSPMDVEQAVRDRIHDAGLVTVDLETLQRAIEALPWVDTASVGRAWPRGLQVRVIEQVAAARWGANGLLNDRG
ncbi:MAG: cell division protein FtsQ/DivIB, partial [Steroidobacteraceae bacterium]